MSNRQKFEKRLESSCHFIDNYCSILRNYSIISREPNIGGSMIKVTRLKGSIFYINEEMIEFLEETPDTVVTLNTGKKVIVLESVDDVIAMIIDFKRKIYLGDYSHLRTTDEGDNK